MRVHWPIVCLALMFLAPAAIAGYMLLSGNAPKFTTSQHGTLITGSPSLDLLTEDLKWQLVFIQPNPCNHACEVELERLNKLYIALGADRDRVAITTTYNEQLHPTAKVNSILILDPRGLYIMRYDVNTDHMGLLKDLRRLLKYSHAQNSK